MMAPLNLYILDLIDYLKSTWRYGYNAPHEPHDWICLKDERRRFVRSIVLLCEDYNAYLEAKFGYCSFMEWLLYEEIESSVPNKNMNSWLNLMISTKLQVLDSERPTCMTQVDHAECRLLRELLSDCSEGEWRELIKFPRRLIVWLLQFE